MTEQQIPPTEWITLADEMTASVFVKAEGGTVRVFSDVDSIIGTFVHMLTPTVIAARAAGDEQALAEARGALFIVTLLQQGRDDAVAFVETEALEASFALPDFEK